MNTSENWSDESGPLAPLSAQEARAFILADCIAILALIFIVSQLAGCLK